MSLLHPELLLLALPALLLWWKFRDRATQWVRLVVLLALSLALAGPHLRTAASGRDLVVVADRSRSMPPENTESALEIVRLAEEERGEGDRIAVVSFGARASVESLSSEETRFRGFAAEPGPDGSDLGAAIEAALRLIPEGRAGSILLLSDGESTGRDPVDAARLAFSRGVRIDAKPYRRPAAADLSLERIDLPERIGAGEPFQFSVWVRADRRVEADFLLERGGRTLSSGRRVFEAGLNRLVFRDRADAAGVVRYGVRLGTDEDRVPENNSGVGALLVEGTRSVLVLNDGAGEDALVRALRAANLPVVVSRPEDAPLDPISLTAHRAVVLENVAAARLGSGTASLGDFVRETGGGLLVTGGKASFGVGGYFRSPLEGVLPVSMEVRQEHRKQAVAIAIALDRSGSMAVEVAPGLRKMDLANQGTAAAIDLLSPIDEIAVVAVDSSPHVVADLSPATDAASIKSRVLRIESMGGGIFVKTALDAARDLLEGAKPQNRHVILFSDAADSEEQEGCFERAESFVRSGITLSVIALGTEVDSDAAFLRELARRGQGEVYFTNRPEELPRLFAQDTLRVARASFIDERTAVTVLPGLFGLGDLPRRGFPALDGYNLTYLRPGSVAGAVTEDDYKAPAFAFRHEGLGRSAAYTGEIGGSFGREVVSWHGFAEFFVTVVRWLAGEDEPQDIFVSARREGSDALVSVELDSPAVAEAGAATVRLSQPDGTAREAALGRVDERRFEVRLPLSTGGISLGTVRFPDGRWVALPPLAVPYSPEFERSPDPERGLRILRKIVEESGGALDVGAGSFFRGERGGRATRSIARELALASLILLLLEIAGRRLQLWGALRVPEPIAALPGKAARAIRRVRPARRPAPAAPAVPEPLAAPPPEEPAPKEVSLAEALRKAKREAGRRLDR